MENIRTPLRLYRLYRKHLPRWVAAKCAYTVWRLYG